MLWITEINFLKEEKKKYLLKSLNDVTLQIKFYKNKLVFSILNKL